MNDIMIKRDIMAKIEITNITFQSLNIKLLKSRANIISAKRLFKKCANIGTNMFSVFKYNMAMHTAKTTAENMLP